MKIYFNRRPVPGPWGGGTKILKSIVDECLLRGHEIFYEEQISSGIKFDALFCMDPRPTNLVTYHDILHFKNKNKNCKLIQRVGDLGTHGKPELFELVKATVPFADVVIFPSNWAKSLINVDEVKCKVIENAPLKQFLTKKNLPPLDRIKIVSHHWSNNEMKGFDIYKQLDNFCQETKAADFTFIGRAPENLNLTYHIGPLDVDGLIEELPKHNVYISASKHEAGANHVLEAIALGLPVLYHTDGGSINEYCKSSGISYTNFNDIVDIILNRTDELKSISSVINYTKSSEDVAKEYVKVLEGAI